MRDVARPLQREDEVVRCGIVPLCEQMRFLQRIERAVDLDAAERFGRETQFVLLRQPGWVKFPAPPLVAPAGNPDPDVADGHGYCNTAPGKRANNSAQV